MIGTRPIGWPNSFAICSAAPFPGKNYPNIATAAFLQNQVTKHTVLPVLACKDIYMSDEVDAKTGQSKARLGDVTRDHRAASSGEPTKLAYAGVAAQFTSPDLIARMLDPGLCLKK